MRGNAKENFPPVFLAPRNPDSGGGHSLFSFVPAAGGRQKTGDDPVLILPSSINLEACGESALADTSSKMEGVGGDGLWVEGVEKF